MRTSIYFIRHAEAQSNTNPDFNGGVDDLTEIGLNQARFLAAKFVDIKIEALYSSNTLRAELTAKEINKVTGLDLEILPYIIEIKGSFPDKFLYSKLPHDEMLQAVRQRVHNPNWEPDMDESFESFKARIVELKNFLESLKYKNVIVVSHARFLKAFAAYIMLGESLTEESAAEISLKLTLGNAAISKLEYNHDKSKWRIDMWNDEAHLAL